MSEYTPTDQEMRDWVVAVDALGGHGGESVRRYDRWFTALKAGVRKAAMEEAAQIAENEFLGYGAAAAIRAAALGDAP